MQFIVSGERIAVENFVTGKLYTILFKTDTQVNLTCTSIGADCVVFQGESPFNLFTLTMRNADTIDTIEPTQLGTNNYNNLINKPQINGVDLIGNRTSSALGIREVPAIIEADDGKVLTAASDGTCSWEVIPEGTTDYTDLTNKPQIAGVTLSGNVSLADLGAAAASDIPTTPGDIGAEPAITSNNKLDPSLIEYDSTHAAITEAQVTQIGTNQNNILSLQNEKPFNDVASSTNQKVIDAISDCRINVLDTSKSVKLVQVYKNYSNIYVITISIDGVNYHVLNKPTSAYTEVAYNAFSYTGVCDGYVIIDWSALDNNTLYSNINSELKQKYKNRYIEYETPKYKNVDIIIPNTVNVAVGKEISLEYFNIVKCSNISDYVVTFTTNNAQIQDYGSRLRIAPTQAATTSETVRVMYNGVEIIKKNFSIKAVTDTKPTIKAIFIGDSFTDGAIYLSELVNMLGTEKITLYGTRTTTAQDSDNNARTIYHEGRSGWSTSDYVNSSSKGGISNPFYNSGFDFSHYITNNPTFSDVTDVFVELGLNDGAGTGFETRYQTICNSIKSYNNNIRIHCLLPTPPCHDGRGFGSRNNISYVTFKDYMFNLCTKIKTLYDNTAGYYIVPTHANLDCWYDFPQTEVAVNSRNPEQITILDDNVHPTKYGYYRYADVVYSDIIANCQS